LLGVKRLFRTLVLWRVPRPAFAAIRTIATFGAATSPAAAIASSAARLFAILPRRTVAVLRARVRSLLHRWPRLLLLLLLRTGLALLIGPPLALGTIGLRTILPAVRALCQRLLALLWNIGLRPFSVRAVRSRLLLSRGSLVAPRLLIASCIAIATLLLVRTAATTVALVIALAVAASATPTATATLAAPMLVSVARFVVATFRALRSRGTNARFVGCRRLLGRFLRLEPAEQTAEES